MAAASNKIASHARSTSLPTGSHPLTLTVEEQFRRLRSSELATSSSISYKLAVLKDLYECVEDFLQLETAQQATEEVLDGSLMLLDVCDTSRDALSQMKQCVQDLQSSIRRRRGGDVNLGNEIGAYMTSRKKVSKMIHKCLTDLKRVDNKNNVLLDDVSILREVEATTQAVLESLLSFLSGPKQSGWSLVSKLMATKRVTHKVEEETSEVIKVDIALNAIICHKSSIGIEVEDVQKPLEALERSIQDLGDGLEVVFRCLIKTRVSLLNILNQ